MYRYFGVGLEIQEEVASIFLIFLCWFPEHRLSTPSKCTLEIRRLVIDNFLNLWYLVIVWSFIILGSFVIFQMSLNPWARCKGYVEYEQALERNGRQVLFECGYGRYWYLGDRMLSQVQHEYPPTTIPIPPYPSVQLADFLTDEEIARARARDGYIVAREGNYSKFIQVHLQGCLASIMVLLLPSKVKFSSFKFFFHIFAL